MKRGTPDHPKTLRLMDALKLRRREAVGILELLWHWTAKFAPAGDIGKYSDRDIARAVDWDGDGSDLVNALVMSGFVDRCGKNRVVVHNWQRHADDGVKKYIARNKLSFAVSVATCPDLSRENKPAPCPGPLPRPLAPAPANRLTDRGEQTATQAVLFDGADPKPKEPKETSDQDVITKRVFALLHEGSFIKLSHQDVARAGKMLVKDGGGEWEATNLGALLYASQCPEVKDVPAFALGCLRGKSGVREDFQHCVKRARCVIDRITREVQAENQLAEEMVDVG